MPFSSRCSTHRSLQGAHATSRSNERACCGAQAAAGTELDKTVMHCRWYEHAKLAHPLDNVVALRQHLQQRDLPQRGRRHALLLHLHQQACSSRQCSTCCCLLASLPRSLIAATYFYNIPAPEVQLQPPHIQDPLPPSEQCPTCRHCARAPPAASSSAPPACPCSCRGPCTPCHRCPPQPSLSSHSSPATGEQGCRAGGSGGHPSCWPGQD